MYSAFFLNPKKYSFSEPIEGFIAIKIGKRFLARSKIQSHGKNISPGY